ncbi:MAG: phosphoribosylglycinamide formyltransferase [Ignavibacteria bacterium]|jgi:formyltetrahydrofolate-dependent phosphoribosylglycinamide formyltransferase|nr:phosphoribosylglycinamide formyltransferase [Ignavibacteria bacterium]
MRKFYICVFASGGGSNFNALLTARRNNVFKSEIKLLISNNSGCGAVDIAVRNNIPFVHISRKVFPEFSNDEYQKYFLDKLNEFGIDLIILSGYMKLVEPLVVKNFRNRILNIHPALLPAFGGKGMFGMNVHKAVIDSRAATSGMTVHLVNDDYDKGRILFQKIVPVDKNDDEFSLQKKILNLEHLYYSQVIRDIEEGKIKLDE